MLSSLPLSYTTCRSTLAHRASTSLRMAGPYDAGSTGGHGVRATAFQQMLQSAVRSLQWTYGLFWQLCRKQGVLVWAEGYYNGTVSTRKMVQSWDEVTEDEASLMRSQELRELYDSLSAREAEPQLAGRPRAALSPEDLTDSEWFYLMSTSFSFPPGDGLPGKAYERQQPIWLSKASEASRRIFPRVLLAKSAQIQTIICIPLADGILEVGTTDNVEEDVALIQHLRSLIMGHCDHSIHNNKPTISELITSSHAMRDASQQLFHLPPLLTTHPTAVGDSYNYVEEDEFDNESDDPEDDNTIIESDAAQAEPNELMQIEMLKEGMLSPNHISNNFHFNLEVLSMSYIMSTCRSDRRHHTSDIRRAWSFNSIDSQSSGVTTIQDMSQDDDEYAMTVSTILKPSLDRSVAFESDKCLGHPRQSAFNCWSYQKGPALLKRPMGSPQQLLKCILCRVPYLRDKHKNQNLLESRDKGRRSIVHKDMRQKEICANHVIAERERREKLKEKFLTLQSMVPFLTKMDKASILDDTIEYIKQLLRSIQAYENQIKLMKSEKGNGAGKHFTQNSGG